VRRQFLQLESEDHPKGKTELMWADDYDVMTCDVGDFIREQMDDVAFMRWRERLRLVPYEPETHEALKEALAREYRRVLNILLGDEDKAP